MNDVAKGEAEALAKTEGKTLVENTARKTLESTEKARRAAVTDAWKQEKELIEETGKGTRQWTKAEIEEIKKTGKVKGYEGHHINNVKDHPELAGNPDNIKFVKGRTEHLAEHSGNWKNKTSGDLIERKPLPPPPPPPPKE